METIETTEKAKTDSPINIIARKIEKESKPSKTNKMTNFQIKGKHL